MFFVFLFQTDVIEMCPNAAELAQQLTHIELERLSFIGPEEFVQAFAKENPHVEPSLKEMKKTRNLEAYVQWFNRLSYFVATHICKVRLIFKVVKRVVFCSIHSSVYTPRSAQGKQFSDESMF